MVIQWDRAFEPAEQVAVQAILGSDPYREALNLTRVFAGPDPDGCWNILFSRKLARGSKARA